MKIKIHRGTHQIGGCITEISTDNTRIIIDMGAELNDENRDKAVNIEGVTIGQKNCDAVFFTHYHGDHLGLYKQILPTIPVYMGEVAKQIFLKLVERIDKPGVPIIEQFLTFHALQKVTIGDIVVTPLLIDHSAYDAYMFLIESQGQKILHTGDFRTHGFRGGKTNEMLEKYVGQVDVLITEGTMLSRDNFIMLTESDLQKQAEILMKTKKFIFVLCSSTNIDRIACFYQANPHGRYFLCDKYESDVLDVVTNSGGKRSKLYSFEKTKVYGDNLKERFNKQGFCMLVRGSPYFKTIIDKFPKEECLIIYSMWKGYLQGANRSDRLADFLSEYQYSYLHTSGHATLEAIKQICNIVKPTKAIIPIHSEAPEKLDVPYNIVILNDNEEFII